MFDADLTALTEAKDRAGNRAVVSKGVDNFSAGELQPQRRDPQRMVRARRNLRIRRSAGRSERHPERASPEHEGATMHPGITIAGIRHIALRRIVKLSISANARAAAAAAFRGNDPRPRSVPGCPWSRPAPVRGGRKVRASCLRPHRAVATSPTAPMICPDG